MDVLSLISSKPASPISDFVDVFDGNHMSISDYYTEGEGLPYYRGQDVCNFFIEQTTSPLKIEERAYQFPYMKRSHLKQGDVLLSIVGTVGSLALVKTNQEATCSCKLAIMRPKKIAPELLAIFLQSKYGQNQIQKYRRGAVQTGLILEDFDQIIIPDFLLDLTVPISTIVNRSFEFLEDSKQAYQQAERVLLEELGLVGFKPSTQGVSIKAFAQSFGTTGRLDAEYYQPKYDDLLASIQKYEVVSLNGFVSKYSTGFPYESELYQDTGIPLIRISNIKKGVLDTDNTAFLSEAYSLISPKDIARTGDIVISLSGTVGNCALIDDAITKCCINQRILAITTHSVERDYLVLLLNSVVGELQFQRVGVGSVQTNISPKDVLEIKIPILPIHKQQEIAGLVQESFRLKTQSEALLEIAKRGVELAIETTQTQAQSWMQSQLEAQTL